jgi:hypothetical protein
MSYLRLIKIEIIKFYTEKRQIFKEECYCLGHNAVSADESLRGIVNGVNGEVGDISLVADPYLMIRGRKCYAVLCLVLQVVNLVGK